MTISAPWRCASEAGECDVNMWQDEKIGRLGYALASLDEMMLLATIPLLLFWGGLASPYGPRERALLACDHV